MKISKFVSMVLFATVAATQLTWAGNTKTYPPRDYFETHAKSEPAATEERSTASVDKDDSASAKPDEDSSAFHEGTGAAGKFYGPHVSRF